MTVIMAYAASGISAIRRDEALGRAENYLVGPVSRLKWIISRLTIVVAVTLLGGVVGSLACYIAVSAQGLDLSFGEIMTAGLNAAVPGLLVLGIGTLTFGLLPRLTSILAFGYIAWSFLVQLLSSGVNIDRHLLNTSIFAHVALSPAADPNWTNNWIIIGIGFAMALIGIAVFTRRDIKSE
jgi:ABC-2 type transport system permease protein